MGTENRIDECPECIVRDRDYSKKSVFHCEFCDKWLCEKHKEPKLSFIPNFNPNGYPSDLKELYYEEYKRKDGHPDFGYSRNKFEQLDVERNVRTQLIKQALDGMNSNYSSSRNVRIEDSDLPLVSGVGYNSSNYSPYHEPKRPPRPEHKRPYRPSKPNLSLHINWKTKRLLKSLMFWLPVFWITVGILFLIEGNNPTSFYNNVPDAIKYVFYIFATGLSAWIGYRIFEKVDSSPTSDRGVYGLKLLSGGFLITGVFMLVFGLFYDYGFFTDSILNPTLSLARATVSVFVVVLGLAFILISAYLIFKFERRSGIIVYRR